MYMVCRINTYILHPYIKWFGWCVDIFTVALAREKVFNILTQNGIRVPRFAVLKRPDGRHKTVCPYTCIYISLWYLFFHAVAVSKANKDGSKSHVLHNSRYSMIHSSCAVNALGDLHIALSVYSVLCMTDQDIFHTTTQIKHVFNVK